MKAMKFRDMEKALKSVGFKKDRQSGDHVIFKKENHHVSIPYRSGKDLCLPFCKRIFKECGINY